MSGIKDFKRNPESGLYKQAFERVKLEPAARDRVLEIAEESRPERGFNGRRRFSMALAVCMAIVLITGTAVAVTAGGGLKNWFSEEWGYSNDIEMPAEQQQLVEKLTTPLGLTETAGKFTFTVDSAAYSDGYYWLLVTAEGMKFDEDKLYDFGMQELKIMSEDGTELNKGGSCMKQVSGDGKMVRMLFEGEIDLKKTDNTGAAPEDGNLRFELSMSDFLERTPKKVGSGYKEKLLQEGSWGFSFEVPMAESDQVIEVPDSDAVFTMNDGGEVTCRVKDIMINTVGIKYLYEGESEAHSELPRLILEGGSQVGVTGGSGVQLDDGSWQMKYQWEMPVDLSQVEAVLFGKTEIEVEA